MKTYKVVLEIEVTEDSPLEAAKEIQRWLDAADRNWQYYVQEADEETIFSVDLEDNDEDAVQVVQNYKPLIQKNNR